MVRFEGWPSTARLGAVVAERFDSELTNWSTFASPTYSAIWPEAADLAVRGMRPRTLAGADMLMGLARPGRGESWEFIESYEAIR